MKFQPNACSSCFKQNFPCLLGGENIYNYLIKYLPVLIILLNSLPVLVASVKDTPGETLVHTFVHSRSLGVSKTQPEKLNNSVFIADCFKSSCLLYVDVLYANVSGSAM